MKKLVKSSNSKVLIGDKVQLKIHTFKKSIFTDNQPTLTNEG